MILFNKMTLYYYLYESEIFIEKSMALDSIDHIDHVYQPSTRLENHKELVRIYVGVPMKVNAPLRRMSPFVNRVLNPRMF